MTENHVPPLSGLLRVVFLGVTALILAAIVYLSQYQPAARDPVSTVFQLLKAQNLQFFVTDRVSIQASSSADTGNLLLGQRVGIVTVPVRLYYGIDLTQLEPSDIASTKNDITVHVPPLHFLDAAVDLSAMQSFTKMTGLQRLKDLATGTDLSDDLRRQLAHEIQRLASRPEMQPDSDTVLAELNGRIAAVSDQLGVSVQFQWRAP